MLNILLKYWVRLALPFFVKDIHISGKDHFAEKGPLVLAVNHPNSFLDALLLGAYMHHPVFYLSRGDVFRVRWIRSLLTILRMIPIYRIRDGKEKLGLNEDSFIKSRWILSRNEILLIFVEGFCIHQTTLQLPLKKGAPRVVDACWRQGIPVRVLPVWLRYSSFDSLPKQIDILLGNIIEQPGDFEGKESAVVWQQINELTASQLKALENQSLLKAKVSSPFIKALLFFPALLGAVVHAPLYLPVKWIVKWATRDNVHYDSVLFAVLLILYPVYIISAGILIALYVSFPWFPFPVVAFPLLARIYVLWK